MKQIIIDILVPHIDALLTVAVAGIIRAWERATMKRKFRRDLDKQLNGRA